MKQELLVQGFFQGGGGGGEGGGGRGAIAPLGFGLPPPWIC